MKAFFTIFVFELNKFFKNKGYLITTAVFMLIVIALASFPRIQKVFTGSEKPGVKDTIWISVSEEASMAMTTEVKDIYLKEFKDAFPTSHVEIVSFSERELFREISDGKAECAFVLTSPLSYLYYINGLGMYDRRIETADEILRETYVVTSMRNAGLEEEEIRRVLSAEVTHEIKNLGKDQWQNFLYTYIMVMALYIVILYYGQGVASSVASEKSSRAMEVLITSVKPVPMIFGKILSASLAGLVQMFCVFGTAIISYQLNQSSGAAGSLLNSLLNIPPSLLGYMLLFFMLGFLIYAFLYGAAGSMVSKLEEVGQAVLPITFLFVIGFLITILAITGDAVNSLPIKVFSFIPVTSPMVMFARIAMGEVSAPEVAASILVLMISVVLTGILSAKIYRAGVLIYGTKPTFGMLIKTILFAK